MKESQLRKLTTCAVCKNKLGQTGVPIFYTLTLQRHILDLEAVRRQTGLAMMLGGNGALAMAMGPDEEMTKPITEKIEMMVCDYCSHVEIMLADVIEANQQPTPSETTI